MSTSNYDRNWGTERVCEFVEKYARATHFLARSLDIPYTELLDIFVRYICANQNRWERVKFIVKDVEKNVLGNDKLRQHLLKHGTAFTYYQNIGYLWDDCFMDQSDSAQIKVDRCQPLE